MQKKWQHQGQEVRPFINKEMIWLILGLAWPTMLEQLMQTAVQYIDTAMVGSLGTQATAAVGATTTINWLISSSIAALSIGFLAYIAKACGAGQTDLVKRAVAQTSLVVLIVGVFFTAATVGLSRQIPVWMQVDPSIQILAAKYFLILYAPMLFRTATILYGTVLRAAGDTKTPMKIGVVVNFINVVFNFLLIYPTRPFTLLNHLGFLKNASVLYIPGAGLGVIGAALASAIAFVVGGIWMTIATFKHPILSPKGQSLKPDWEILQPCLKIAFPNMLQRFATSFGYVAFASLINSIGEVATAAHTIANTVESAFYIPGYGMQTAAATLAGNAYGANDNKHMEELARMFLPIEIFLMIISGASLFILAPELVQIFSKSDEVIQLGTTVLRMVAVSEPFYGFSIIVEGMMQGVGKTKEPFVYNISGMWGVRIIGTFITTQFLGMGLISAWACMIAHNMLLFMLYLMSYIRKSWNPLAQLENVKKC